jgi:glycolate oxidase FAD binding subunit
MTVTAAADVTLEELQRRLAAVGQWLPVDCIDPRQTLGELVERQPTGPLRLGYGAWRDLLLGCQFLNGNDELITAGGRVVKNVAGYDLTKFMAGSFGVFGKLLTITARTYRRPEFALSAFFEPDVKRLNQLIPSGCRPQWSMLDRQQLICGYLGDERTISYIESRLAEWRPTRVEPRWQISEDQTFTLIFDRGRDVPRFVASVPPAKVMEFANAAAVQSWHADPAFGLVVGYPLEEAARAKIIEAARKVGGSVTFFNADGAAAQIGAPAGPAAMLKKLKAAFDPHGRLNPLPDILEWSRSA